MKTKGESIGDAVLRAIKEAAKVDPKAKQFLQNLDQIPSTVGKANLTSHFLSQK